MDLEPIEPRAFCMYVCIVLAEFDSSHACLIRRSSFYARVRARTQTQIQIQGESGLVRGGDGFHSALALSLSADFA